MSDQMKKYGVLGKNIDYSHSPKLFHRWFEIFNKNATFEIINKEKINLEILEQELLNIYDGFCITIPYKKIIFDLVITSYPSHDIFVDGSALRTLNCNLLRLNHEAIQHNRTHSKERVFDIVPKKISLYNTDCLALNKLFKTYLIKRVLDEHEDTRPIKVVLLGGGGAALSSYDAIQDALSYCSLLSHVDLVNRFQKHHYLTTEFLKNNRRDLRLPLQEFSYESYFDDIFLSYSRQEKESRHDHFQILIINASPMGSGRAFDDSSLLSKVLSLYAPKNIKLIVDWVYNEEQTVCERFASCYQIPIITGKTLLLTQAKLNFQIWMGEEIE